MKNTKEIGYNERLFSGGLRARLHLARFHWIRNKLLRIGCSYDSVLELGCFDGKLIDFLAKRPNTYLGFDANWEGGLDIAAEKWEKHPNYVFRVCQRPEEMSVSPDEQFDIAVIMETLEHVSPDLVDGYLEKTVQHTREYIFVTVPNEKGILFLAKWLVKKFFSKDAEPYSFSELINATLGRMNRVIRREHKGFDYDAIIHKIARHVDVIDVSGMPFGFLPPSLNFNVGIIGRIRRRYPICHT